MLSRQIAKRTPRKCNLSLEALHARIAPTGVLPASTVIASMSSIGTGSGIVGVYHAPSAPPAGTPFYTVGTTIPAAKPDYLVHSGPAPQQ